MRTTLIGLLLALVGVCGGVYWYFGGFSIEGGEKLAFIDAYATYYEESTEMEALIHSTSGSGSQDRQALFVLFSSILIEQLEPDVRLMKTKEALHHLAMIETSLRSAEERVRHVRGAIDDVGRATEEFSSQSTRAHARALVDLMSAHTELLERTLADLRGANDQTRSILTQVEQDEGILTDDHVISINETTSDAEARFDQLTRHFDELASLATRRNDTYQAFVDRAF